MKKKHRFCRSPEAAAGVLAAEQKAVDEINAIMQERCQHEWEVHDTDMWSFSYCPKCGKKSWQEFE